MEKSEIKKKVVRALANIYVFIEDGEEDTYLDTYIEDSIQFMSLIVELEEILEIEFPSQILMFDNFKTLNTICELVEELMAIRDNE